MSRFGALLSFSFLFFLTAEMSFAGETLKQITICRNLHGAGTKGVRTLRVYEGDDQTCKATYSKTELEQTVGLNRSNKQCDSILAGIQKTLEESNWNCKKMKSVSVLESKEARPVPAERPARTL